jgi:hypothetical protein
LPLLPLAVDLNRQRLQIAEVDQPPPLRHAGYSKQRSQHGRVRAVAVDLFRHQQLRNQQLGGEAVGLALAQPLR